MKDAKQQERPRPPEPEEVADLGLALNRCPFCHDDVEVESSDWVPCATCQARHHVACWTEAGCCAACGASQHLVPGQAIEPASPRWKLKLFAALSLVFLFLAGVRYDGHLQAPEPETVVVPAPTVRPAPTPPTAAAPPRAISSVTPEYAPVPELDPEVELRSWWTQGFSKVRDDPAAAIPAFERALAFDPEHRYFRASLGRLIEARARTGDHEGAIGAAARFLEFENRSGFSEAYTWRALAHLGLGEIDKAIADADQALAITKNRSSIAFCFRGDAYLRQGLVEKALADYERAIAVSGSPFQSYPYRHRGRARYQQGDYAGALTDHRQALVAPQIPNEHARDLAWIARAQAALSCAAPLERDPRFSFPYDEKGAPRGTAHLQGTLAQFQLATGLRVQKRYATLYRALGRRLSGDAQGALADYGQLVLSGRADPKVLIGRGNARFDLGDLEGALEDFTTALSKDAKCREALFNRGLVHWRMKLYELAETDLTAALWVDIDLAQAYAIRGLARLALGDPVAGVSDLERAYGELPPGSPGAKELKTLDPR